MTLFRLPRAISCSAAARVSLRQQHRLALVSGNISPVCRSRLFSCTADARQHDRRKGRWPLMSSGCCMGRSKLAIAAEARLSEFFALSRFRRFTVERISSSSCVAPRCPHLRSAAAIPALRASSSIFLPRNSVFSPEPSWHGFLTGLRAVAPASGLSAPVVRPLVRCRPGRSFCQR